MDPPVDIGHPRYSPIVYYFSLYKSSSKGICRRRLDFIEPRLRCVACRSSGNIAYQNRKVGRRLHDLLNYFLLSSVGVQISTTSTLEPLISPPLYGCSTGQHSCQASNQNSVQSSSKCLPAQDSIAIHSLKPAMSPSLKPLAISTRKPPCNLGVENHLSPPLHLSL